MAPVELQPVIVVFGAMTSALFAFSGMVLFGVRLVRWLQLPQDLPEGARYEPPAPPAHYDSSFAEAGRIAALTAARATVYAQAHAAYRAAVFTHDAAAQLRERSAAAPDDRTLAQATATAVEAATTAGVATTSADAALPTAAAAPSAADIAAVASTVAMFAATAESAQQAATQALSTVPTPPRSRRLLYVLIAILAAWALAMLILPGILHVGPDRAPY